MINWTIKSILLLDDTAELVFKNILCNDPMGLFDDDSYDREPIGYEQSLDNLRVYFNELKSKKKELLDQLQWMGSGRWYTEKSFNEYESALGSLLFDYRILGDLEDFDYVSKLASRFYEMHQSAVALVKQLATCASCLMKKAISVYNPDNKTKIHLEDIKRSVWSKCGKLRKLDDDVLAELDSLSDKEMFIDRDIHHSKSHTPDEIQH